VLGTANLGTHASLKKRDLKSCLKNNKLSFDP
jgi:hypothetical protein